MNCAPIEKVVRINSTSGTTGMPTFYAVTARDVAVINEMHARKYWRAGIRPGHIMLQALSLSMFTGGLPLSQGIQHLGACVVPVGIEGGTRRVIEHIEMLRPQAIIATPSFGLYLIEQAPRLAGKPARELGLALVLLRRRAGRRHAAGAVRARRWLRRQDFRPYRRRSRLPRHLAR